MHPKSNESEIVETLLEYLIIENKEDRRLKIKNNFRIISQIRKNSPNSSFGCYIHALYEACLGNQKKAVKYFEKMKIYQSENYDLYIYNYYSYIVRERNLSLILKKADDILNREIPKELAEIVIQTASFSGKYDLLQKKHKESKIKFNDYCILKKIQQDTKLTNDDLFNVQKCINKVILEKKIPFIKMLFKRDEPFELNQIVCSVEEKTDPKILSEANSLLIDKLMDFKKIIKSNVVVMFDYTHIHKNMSQIIKLG